jgi:hypothetical protein
MTARARSFVPVKNPLTRALLVAIVAFVLEGTAARNFT